MNYKQTTQVPNEVFDIQLSQLSHSELKILLYVIRQTYGWKLKNGKRKTRDRISHSQFISKCNISRRILSPTIQSLILKQLIRVSDYQGNLLHTPESRKGKVSIYYAPCFLSCAIRSTRVGKMKHVPRRKGAYNKTNTPKLKETKGVERICDATRISEILHQKKMRMTAS